MTQRQIIVLIIASVLILGAGFGISRMLASMKKEQEKKPPRENIRSVKAEAVKYKDLETELTAYGRVGSAQAVDIMAEVPGKILMGSIPLKKGQNFRKGQILAKLNEEEARLTLLSQKSSFLKSLADILPDLKMDYADRFEAWQNYFESIDVQKAMPEIPLGETSREKTFLASRGILSEYYNIKSSEERLTKYALYAPYTGSFSDVFLETGSIANPGVRIARIIRTDKLELETPIPAEDIQWVKRGSVVKIQSEDGSQTWRGVVSRVSDRADPTTQSVNVYITIYANSTSQLYEGLYLQAVIPGKVVRKAMEVPRKTVFNRNEIFVVEDGRLRKKQVSVHKLNASTVLFSGLKEGEMIVMDPPVNATENMKVTLAEN